MSTTFGSPFSVMIASAHGPSSAAGALEQALVAVDVERRERRRAGERMGRIGVAVEELDAAPAPS